MNRLRNCIWSCQAMPFKSGDRLCNCTLLQQCGSGVYGEVWLAEDAIGIRIVLKVLANRGSYSERELAGLKHYAADDRDEKRHRSPVGHAGIRRNRVPVCEGETETRLCGYGEYLPVSTAGGDGVMATIR